MKRIRCHWRIEKLVPGQYIEELINIRCDQRADDGIFCRQHCKVAEKVDSLKLLSILRQSLHEAWEKEKKEPV